MHSVERFLETEGNPMEAKLLIICILNKQRHKPARPSHVKHYRSTIYTHLKLQIQSHDVIGFVKSVSDRIIFFMDNAHTYMFIESDSRIVFIDIEFYARLS